MFKYLHNHNIILNEVILHYAIMFIIQIAYEKVNFTEIHNNLISKGFPNKNSNICHEQQKQQTIFFQQNKKDDNFISSCVLKILLIFI